MRFQTRKACRFALVIALGLPGVIRLHALDAGMPEQQAAEALRLVRYTARALDGQGKPLQGDVELHFALYQGRTDRKPVWSESQKVQVDGKGKYSVQLGSATKGGLPVELFSNGEAHWLGVQVNELAESPRVRLLSVPYALTAADAQSLGGLPASAYMQVAQGGSIAGSPLPGSSLPALSGQATASALSPLAALPVTVLIGPGLSQTALPMALFNGVSSLSFAQLNDTGANVGIGTPNPAAKLDVKGTGFFRGPLSVNSSAATASAGANSPVVTLTASAFNSATGAAADQSFSMRSTALGNNTATPSAKLDTLIGTTSTGFSISNKGMITFAGGQNIPGGITFKAPASDFVVTGSPLASGTLGLNWNVPPSAAPTPNSIAKFDNLGFLELNELDVSGGVAANGIGLISRSDGATPLVVFNNLEDQNPNDHAGTAVSAFTSSKTAITVNADTSNSGQAIHATASAQAIVGESFGTQDSVLTKFAGDGVDGLSHSGLGSGVAAINDAHGAGIFALLTDCQCQVGAHDLAGSFQGNVQIDGRLGFGGGSFRIDHPLDPANKYLSHSFVQSPDMTNIYSGNVTTNAKGEAVVELPDWFEGLNENFHYHLTVMGKFAHAMVGKEIAHNQFTILTDEPGVKVSWEVEGVRHDAWANAHRIPVEENKNAEEQGKYLHPELYGKGWESSISLMHHPALIKKLSDPATANLPFATVLPTRKPTQPVEVSQGK